MQRLGPYRGLFLFNYTSTLSMTRRRTDRTDRSLGASFSGPCQDTWISSNTSSSG